MGRQPFASATYRSGPTRVDRIQWMGASAGPADRSVRYGWLDNGLLQTKQIYDQPFHLYGYDDQRRVTALLDSAGWKVLEAYEYDPLGNLKGMLRDDVEWTYPTPSFSRSPGRAATTGAAEFHTWDTVGRMQTWLEMDSHGDFIAERSFTYDGAGRLVGLADSARNVNTSALYDYDASNALVRERRQDSAGARTVLRFAGYRYDALEGSTIQKLLPMVSLESGSFRWTFLEPDGHALETFDSDGTSKSFEVLGVYGVPLAGLSQGSWEVDDFHGVDVDTRNRVMHMGARHAVQRDGMWMQPEPLLYLDMTNGDLSRPLYYGGVYAAGNPVMLEDISGHWPSATDAAGFAGGFLIGANYAAPLAAWDMGTLLGEVAAGKKSPSALVPAAVAVNYPGVGIALAVDHAGQQLAQDGMTFESGLAVGRAAGDIGVATIVLGEGLGGIGQSRAVPGGGTHRAGAEKAWRSGAEPNSKWTQTSADGTKAVQNTIYDSKGNAIGQVDFKQHGAGAPPGHGHTFPPGQPGAGHGPGATHLAPAEVPSGWSEIPPGLQPAQPVRTK